MRSVLSTTSGNAFVMEFSPSSSGTPAWAVEFGGTGYASGQAIAAQASAWYMAGGFSSGDITIPLVDGTTTTFSSVGESDLFVIKGFGSPRPPTRAPSPAPTTRPTRAGETYSPTAAPTRSCIPGEYRPAPTEPCAFCAPGTFWNETTPSTACRNCTADQTSLQGATTCYTPCQPKSALNTTDLTCVAIPGSLDNIAAANNLTIDFATTEVFIVTEPSKLEDTLGAAAFAGSSGKAVVVVLGPGAYPQTEVYTLTSNVYILVDSAGGEARRRQLLHADHRHLGLTIENAVLTAPSSSRHFVMSSSTLVTDRVLFQSALDGSYSGGVELRDGAQALFYNTTFRHCQTTGNGGALLLEDGSTALVGTGSAFLNNAAAQGGAIYTGAGCSVTVEDAVRFVNNSAPRTSASTGGGGAVYLAGASASLALGPNVLFEGNVGDDATVAAGGRVTCTNPAYAASIDCATGCTGSYNVPLTCPICSSSTPAGSCTTCPQGSYGGTDVALACELCGYGYTTIYPPSSTSVADCVPTGL